MHVVLLNNVGTQCKGVHHIRHESHHHRSAANWQLQLGQNAGGDDLGMFPEPWMDELPAFNAPRGCPCTAQLLCQADERRLFEADCHIPLHGERTYSMHGGAGEMFSLHAHKH